MRTDLLRLGDLPGTWQYWSAAKPGHAWYAPVDAVAKQLIEMDLGLAPDISNGMLSWPEQNTRPVDTATDLPLF